MEDWKIRVESKIDVTNALLARFVQQQDEKNRDYDSALKEVERMKERSNIIAAIGICISGLIAAVVSGLSSK